MALYEEENDQAPRLRVGEGESPLSCSIHGASAYWRRYWEVDPLDSVEIEKSAVDIPVSQSEQHLVDCLSSPPDVKPQKLEPQILPVLPPLVYQDTFVACPTGGARSASTVTSSLGTAVPELGSKSPRPAKRIPCVTKGWKYSSRRKVEFEMAVNMVHDPHVKPPIKSRERCYRKFVTPPWTESTAHREGSHETLTTLPGAPIPATLSNSPSLLDDSYSSDLTVHGGNSYQTIMTIPAAPIPPTAATPLSPLNDSDSSTSFRPAPKSRPKMMASKKRSNLKRTRI